MRSAQCIDKPDNKILVFTKLACFEKITTAASAMLATLSNAEGVLVGPDITQRCTKQERKGVFELGEETWRRN